MFQPPQAEAASQTLTVFKEIGSIYFSSLGSQTFKEISSDHCQTLERIKEKFQWTPQQGTHTAKIAWKSHKRMAPAINNLNQQSLKSERIRSPELPQNSTQNVQF